MNFTFPKAQKLCNKKKITNLFENGRVIKKYPLLMKWLSIESEIPFQIMVNVPKRLFKRAVDRNLLKRRMREAIRLNKHIVVDSLDENKSMIIALIYTSKDLLDFKTVNMSVEHCFTGLCEEV